MSLVIGTQTIPLDSIRKECKTRKETKGLNEFRLTKGLTAEMECKQCHKNAPKKYQKIGSLFTRTPQGTKDAIVADYQNGLSMSEIAAKYQLNVNTLVSWKISKKMDFGEPPKVIYVRQVVTDN